MPRLSESFRTGLEREALRFHVRMGAEVRSSLAGRGIDDKAIGRYKLGEVQADSLEHGKYAGWISIPYITRRGGTVSLKFRRMDEGKPKYISPYPTRLYNTLAMDRADRLGFIAIQEGEFDAIVLDCYCGIPAVGAPGTDTWAKHPEWRDLFSGYPEVLVYKDNDEAGEKFASAVTRDLRQAKVISLSSGRDVNEAYLNGGLTEIRRKAGLEG